MSEEIKENSITIYDERRNIFIAKSEESMLTFATEHFINSAHQAIKRSGHFAVALSGGSTPKRIFQNITSEKYRKQIDWEKVLLFWSDERAVPPDHPDSNYHMAIESGFGNVPLLATNIFRMCAENDIENNAKKYEQIMRERLPNGALDLVMLGMGEDGHTASLFPNTHALESHGRLVLANYIPRLQTWRTTLTFDAINNSNESTIYVTGKNKAALIKQIFPSSGTKDLLPKDNLPIDLIGTFQHPALWILDAQAASGL